MKKLTCDGPTLIHGKGLRAIDCATCGYAHLWPLPTQEKLDRLYRDEYYQRHYARWFAKERREQWYWRKVYQQRVRTFERLTSFPLESRWQIYDAGCGMGWFGKAIHDWSAEYSVVGYEPNELARKEAAKIRAMVLADDVLGANKHPTWNMVHASLLLEHLRDPLEFLRRAHKDILPGGAVCVVAPNEFNDYQKRLKRFGYSPLTPFHLNYFTIDSLRRLLERAGFNEARLAATFPIEWFALHGLNYVKRPRLGAVAHWARMVVECAALTHAPGWWEWKREEWAARGIGREIEAWGYK